MKAPKLKAFFDGKYECLLCASFLGSASDMPKPFHHHQLELRGDVTMRKTTILAMCSLFQHGPLLGVLL